MLAGAHGPASAQDAPRLAQAPTVHAFNIPAQPLFQALALLGQQARIQVAIDTATARSKTSSPVVGSMSVDQALRQMLEGTGLLFQFTPGGAATVYEGASGSGALQLDPVNVQGSLPPPTATIGVLPPAAPGGQVAVGGTVGLLGDRTFQDIPFAITSYTSTLVENQQARTIGDVVKNDPGATKVATQAYDTLRIRGYSVPSSAISVDGLFGLTAADRTPLEGFERVEVLKGPSTFLNGSVGGAVGGTVNLVPKRAAKDPIANIGVLYGSAGQAGVQADLGGRFGADGEFGARFNGLFRDGYTSLQNNRDRVGDAQLSLDYMGSGLRATLNFGYSKKDQQASNQIFTLSPTAMVPPAPNAMRAVQQPWEFFNTEFAMGLGRVEVDLGDRFTAYAAYGQSFYREIVLRTLASNITSAGTFTQSASQGSQNYWRQSGEAGLRGDFETGFVKHKVAMATTGYWEIRSNQTAAAPTFTITNNLYNPSFFNAPAYVPITTTPAKVSATTLTSFALSDTLSAWDDRVQLTLGGRNQSIENVNYGLNGGPTATYFASAFTPAVGIVVKPWSNFSLYGNYIEGLEPGPVAPLTAVNAGQVFAPLISKQIEFGAKLDLGSWSATLGFFQITQPSGVQNTATNIFSVDGLQNNQGIDFSVFGEPLAGLRVLGGLMLLNAKYLNTANGAYDGNKVVGAPDLTLKFGVEKDLDFIKGLTLSGRVNYFSSQYANVLNTQVMRAYTIVDIGARYTFEIDTKQLTLRANIDNLLNESVWASAFAGGLIYRGTPQSIYLNLSAAF